MNPNFSASGSGYPQALNPLSRDCRHRHTCPARIDIAKCAGSNTGLFRIRNGYQADLPTLEDSTRASSWISRAQPHARWARRPAEPTRSRASPHRAVAAGSKRFGLGAARRLSQKARFERLLRHGRRRNLAGYTFFLEARDSGGPRLGILVSKKHAARATVRNGLKRCIREAFRLEQETLDSLDLLVRPPYGLVPSAQMINQLRQLLRRLNNE